MRNASGVNQFKAVDQNGNNGMLFKVKDNSEFSVNVWKDNAFGNEKILATKDDFKLRTKEFTCVKGKNVFKDLNVYSAVILGVASKIDDLYIESYCLTNLALHITVTENTDIVVYYRPAVV